MTDTASAQREPEQLSRLRSDFFSYPYLRMPKPVPDEIAHAYLKLRYNGVDHGTAMRNISHRYRQREDIWNSNKNVVWGTLVNSLLDCLYIPIQGKIKKLAESYSPERIAPMLTADYKIRYANGATRDQITAWGYLKSRRTSHAPAEIVPVDLGPAPTNDANDANVAATNPLPQDLPVDPSLLQAHNNFLNQGFYEGFAPAIPYSPAGPEATQDVLNPDEFVGFEEALQAVREDVFGPDTEADPEKVALLQRVDTLEKQITDLEDKNADLQDKTANLEDKIADLEIDNANLTEEIQDVRAELRKVNRELYKTRLQLASRPMGHQNVADSSTLTGSYKRRRTHVPGLSSTASIASEQTSTTAESSRTGGRFMPRGAVRLGPQMESWIHPRDPNNGAPKSSEMPEGSFNITPFE